MDKLLISMLKKKENNKKLQTKNGKIKKNSMKNNKGFSNMCENTNNQ